MARSPQRRPPDAARRRGRRRAPLGRVAVRRRRSCGRTPPRSGRSSRSTSARTASAAHRRGLFASLRPEPYENRVVLPHERTHAGPKEGRLRLLRATGVHFEPIFLLYDGEPPFDVSHRATRPRGRGHQAVADRPERDRRGVRPQAAADRRRSPPLRDGAFLRRRRDPRRARVDSRSRTDDLPDPPDRRARQRPSACSHRPAERARGSLEAESHDRAAAVLYRSEGDIAVVHGREGSWTYSSSSRSRRRE